MLEKHLKPVKRIQKSTRRIKRHKKIKYKRSRKSYRARVFWAPRVRYRKRKFSRIRRIKVGVRKKYRVSKPRAGTIIIKHTRKNSFLTLTRKKKNKAKNKYGKLTRKPQYLVLKAMSMGHLKTYKGRAKKSSVALRALSFVWQKRY